MMMKNSAKTWFIIALLTLPLMPAIGQMPTPPPLISVSGSAEVKVAPDEINLRVGVETRNEDLAEARRDNDERISRSLAFLKSSGLEDKDVQTDFINMEPIYENSFPRTKTTSYVVRKSIEIKLTKIDYFESILTGLLTNGVNTVQGIEFRTSELRKHRDEARALAIQAAREKADAMASELGVKRGKVYSINVNDSGGWWGSGNGYWSGSFGGGMYQNAVQDAGGAYDESRTLSVGQISVSATVNVSFLIE